MSENWYKGAKPFTQESAVEQKRRKPCIELAKVHQEMTSKTREKEEERYVD